MLKKELRSKYSQIRLSISPQDHQEKSIKIANALLGLPIWEKDVFHLFLPIEEKGEIETSHILSILQGRDKHIVVPKVDGSHLLHYLLTDGTLFKKSKWGVPEPIDGIEIDPQKIDVVFVPLLAYDRMGNRVGYGKGFYDRFLKDCRRDVLKIGLSFFGAEDKIDDVGIDDIALDCCVTPDKTYSFPK